MDTISDTAPQTPSVPAPPRPEHNPLWGFSVFWLYVIELFGFIGLIGYAFLLPFTDATCEALDPYRRLYDPWHTAALLWVPVMVAYVAMFNLLHFVRLTRLQTVLLMCVLVWGVLALMFFEL